MRNPVDVRKRLVVCRRISDVADDQFDIVRELPFPLVMHLVLEAVENDDLIPSVKKT